MKISRSIAIHLVCICGLVLILAILNHIPHTILSGWDNLQTELNPALGIKRAFYSVWQEYQSFGLVAGMAHAADLPRAVFVWMLSFILPTSLIRYCLHFLLVLIGAIGTYWLLIESGLKNNKTHFAFAGSVAYIFSFASLQLLALPFEAFVFFFAFLPWEVALFVKLIHQKQLNNSLLTAFILINIIGSPQWVAQQLFVVYGCILTTIGFYYGIKNRTAKRTFLLLASVLLINSFWILPQIYFLLTHGSVVWTNKINQLSTGDILYSNLAHGTLQSFIRQEGFFYDRLGISHNFLFESWRSFRMIPIISISIVSVFLCSLLGVFNKSNYRVGFALLGLIIVVALLTNVFPLNLINDLIRSNGFINQVFRSPFTKFAIPYALVFSYFFAWGLEKISKILSRDHVFSKIVVLAGVLIILCISVPAFKGNYLIKDMSVSYPKDYTDAIEYFKHQNPNQRIALMPDYTFWGWFFHSWGYNGSGFLWYGIEQPIISRTFDVWNEDSENYFWQMKAALEAEDVDRVIRTLNKYSVDYVILDTSLEAVSSNIKALQYDRIVKLLDSSLAFHSEYSGKNLHIYKFLTNTPHTSFISTSGTLPNIDQNDRLTDNDIAYETSGTYISKDSADIIYPFNQLFSQSRRTDRSWKIEINKNFITLTSKLPSQYENYDIIIPKNEFDETTIIDNKEMLLKGSLDITSDSVNLFVRIPLVKIPTLNISYATSYPCGTKNDSNLEFKSNDGAITTTAIDGAVGCISLSIPYIDQRFGYVASINSHTTSGRPPFFALTDQTKSQSIIEDRLLNNEELFLIPPHYMYGLGYTLNFQIDSYPKIPATATVLQPQIYYLPYDILSHIRYEKKNRTTTSSLIHPSETIEITKKNVYTYDLLLKQTDKVKNIILWQSFDNGWIAIDTKNLKILDSHFPINNWANGWELDEATIAQAKGGPIHIVLFFWPQLLEYAGFVLLFLTLSAVILHKKRSHGSTTG